MIRTHAATRSDPPDVGARIHHCRLRAIHALDEEAEHVARETVQPSADCGQRASERCCEAGAGRQAEIDEERVRGRRRGRADHGAGLAVFAIACRGGAGADGRRTQDRQVDIGQRPGEAVPMVGLRVEAHDLDALGGNGRHER